MVSVWLFVVGIILIVLVVMKITSEKQAIAVKLVMVLFIFLMLTAGYVYMTSDGDFTSVNGVENFAQNYYTWFLSAFGNVKTATSNAVSMDWGLKNETKR